jgi:hypothetical protein
MNGYLEVIFAEARNLEVKAGKSGKLLSVKN